MSQSQQTQGKKQPLDCRLDANVEAVRSAMGDSQDLIIKAFTCLDGCRMALLYVEGLADKAFIHDSILIPLLQHAQSDARSKYADNVDRLHGLINELTAGDVSLCADMDTLLVRMLSGDAILLSDDCNESLRIAAAGWEDRPVGEPTSQAVVRGPMEAFTENIRKNTALIRRRIKDPRLWLETRQIGTVTRTDVSIMYLKHLVDENVVRELRRRLDRIDIDGILEGGYIEEFIQDKTLTPFQTVYNSERPDSIAAGLLEGRVAILVDGTPFVLLVPALFIHYFQAAEDYYQRADISTLLRVIRVLSFFLALLAPSFYIAITTYHQEMLPTSLLISLAAQREGVPFPAFIEALMMEVTYEILREAGVRMPRTVGQAVSIVGTLVIGQAAVEAGIVSAVMVIIVSITAISSYVIPSSGMSISVRMIRFVLMGLAASFGFYGILVGLIILVLHLTSLTSFGVPYMSPLGPFEPQDQKDTLFRIAWPKMLTRPRSNKPEQLYRRRRNLKSKR
ncbi:spore germination protein [Paenibacillus hemerocallicola]|uniref:Spore germination protein n=1 Tax=Paenibacillus hemerocallicola TaxID=1172614 RepID=A0A5C4T1Z2_9BACL|nr:spore germination protein [Paenibacillus hemerocallicola]TNJ62906.1 spore germination protein [Paenibacillus hemerocallicola]